MRPCRLTTNHTGGNVTYFIRQFGLAKIRRMEWGGDAEYRRRCTNHKVGGGTVINAGSASIHSAVVVQQ